MERQKTIEKAFTLTGKGLQTGKSVKADFHPAEENAGLVFVRKDLKNKPPIRLCDYSSLSFRTDRRTIVGTDAENYVETVEHLLAAVWGAGIDNLQIAMDSSEPPALDGSAIGFLDAFEKAGTREGKAERKFVEIKEPVWADDRESFVGAFPGDLFKISYIFEHPYLGAGRQFFSKVLDGALFRKEIAPARTLWLVPPGEDTVEAKAEAVKRAGYGRGADPENTLIIDKTGPVNAARFDDEPVRHGVLDLVGDLYLLGARLKGRIIAVRSGHRLNLELVKKLMRP